MTTPLLLDAVVIVAYFAVVFSVGLWMSRGKKSVESFALGGRQIAWWAVLASILAAEISAISWGERQAGPVTSPAHRRIN